MNLKDLVVSLKFDKEMKELGAEQESYFCWIRYIARDGSKSKWAIAQSYDPISGRIEVYAAYTLAEVDEMLPDHVEKGNMKYYLHITKTKKTEYFVLPDYYISYVNISGSHYLHSEREDKGVDAHAKMWIYLKKEGLL